MVSSLPGLTTILILVTFILVLFRGYNYVKNILNSKANLEEFSNSARDFVDRAPFVRGESDQASHRQRTNRVDDEYIQSSEVPAETFDFDASEVGASCMHDNYEDYSGSDINSSISDLEKILQGS